PRQSRLSETETRTGFTLWAIARSPLILGGNLTQAPTFLIPMLSNTRVIALNQESRVSRPLAAMPGVASGARIWVSAPRHGKTDTVGIFNVGEQVLQIDLPWAAFGFPARRFAACNLWTRHVSASS